MMVPPYTHGSLIVPYTIAILTLVIHTIDIGIQCRTGQKWSNFLLGRVFLLLFILFVDVGLISFIEVDRSEEGTLWVAATWVLIQFSVLFAISLEFVFFLKICNSLDKRRCSRKLAYILTFSVLSVVLILIILASAFALVHSLNQIAVVLLVLGCSSAHLFASLFPLWLLSRGGDLLPVLRNRRSWGLLSCLSFSILAAIVSLGLFGLSGLYPKFLGELIIMFASLIPWTTLKFYKLTKVNVRWELTESSGSDMRPIGDITEPPVMEE